MTLLPLTSVGATHLEWVRTKSPCHELRAGELVVAILRWEHTLDALATAQAAEGSWVFRRRGRLVPRQVTVRTRQPDAEIALLNCSQRRDPSLVFADGRTYRWLNINHTTWMWVTGGLVNVPLLRLCLETRFFSYRARVEIEAEGRRCADLSLLALLGWYQMVLKHEDDTATALSAALAATAG
ncbi:MAG: hypothetical protein ACUVX9_04340 [Anaerolineae bacterium]